MDQSAELILPSRAHIGSWYTKILTGLAVANEQSLPANRIGVQKSQYTPEVQRGESHKVIHQTTYVNYQPRVIYTALDPFLALPTSVTHYERSRIQIYLSLVSYWFASSNDTIPSPTWIHCIRTTIHSPIGRQWMCILAEEATSPEIRAGAAPSKQLVRQKRMGYENLNSALRACHLRFEDVLMGLSMMGPELMTFGTESQRNLHVTAVDLVLQSKKSLMAALKALRHMDPWFVSAQFGFGKCRFADQAELTGVLEQWKANLLGILYTPRPYFVTANPNRSKDDPNYECHLLQTEVTDYVLTLCPDSSPSNTFPQATQLGILLELAWTMLHFAASATMSCYFYRQMKYLTARVVLTPKGGQRGNTFPAVTVAPAMATARKDTISTYCPEDLLGSEAEICEIVINALKMFMYLEPHGRQLIIEKLAVWLKTEPVNIRPSPITKVEIDHLEDQIVRTWMSTRSDPSHWGPS